MDDSQKIFFADRAEKQLRSVPKTDRERIVSRLEAYAESPQSPQHDVVRIVGTDALRLRCGDWRIVFERADGGQVKVLRVGHRREVYR